MDSEMLYDVTRVDVMEFPESFMEQLVKFLTLACKSVVMDERSVRQFLDWYNQDETLSMCESMEALYEHIHEVLFKENNRRAKL